MTTKVEERPILLNSEMVQAVLAGQKTQTRRVIQNPNSEVLVSKCPYGRVGTRLWVRETWKPCAWDEDFQSVWIQYRADNEIKRKCSDDLWNDFEWSDDEPRAMKVFQEVTDQCLAAGTPGGQIGTLEVAQSGCPTKWRPSIFMPRAACRIFLEVTSVKFQQIQSITPAEAIAEGVVSERHGQGLGSACDEIRALESFRQLWDGIYSKRGYGWGVNPWVWVVEFKLLG